MTLRLFDEAQGKKVAFTPEGGAALCWRVRLWYGDRVSLSDIRPGVVVDVLGRWLAFNGHAVTCSREVIDTDLVPSTAAAREGQTPQSEAYRRGRELAAACAVVGLTVSTSADPPYDVVCSPAVEDWVEVPAGTGLQLRTGAIECEGSKPQYWLQGRCVTSNELIEYQTVLGAVDLWRPRAIRLFLSMRRYQTDGYFARVWSLPDRRDRVVLKAPGLAVATAYLKRVDGFVVRAASTLPDLAYPPFLVGRLAYGEGPAPEEVPVDFADAMDNDLNVAGALDVVSRVVREGSTALDRHDGDAAAVAFREVVSMLDVLGLRADDPVWQPVVRRDADTVQALVERLLEERTTARRHEDWARVQRITATLAAAAPGEVLRAMRVPYTTGWHDPL